MWFQTAVNLIYTVSHVNLVHVSYMYYVFLCIHFCLWSYLCSILYRLIKLVKICAFGFCPCDLLGSTFFIEKCDCDNIILVLFVVIINTILVKLVQMIWNYITGFAVCQCFCLSLELYLWKTCISLSNSVMSPMLRFSETWSSGR